MHATVGGWVSSTKCAADLVGDGGPTFFLPPPGRISEYEIRVTTATAIANGNITTSFIFFIITFVAKVRFFFN